jgi:pimeloyl-ACP methyl ester carboxylesterase
MSAPSLLLVHGGWLRPAHWKLVIDELSGVDVHTVALPSSGDDPAALGDMFADADAISAAVAAIDGPVVVLAHSAGGVPTTQALAAASNVRRIVYVAAFLLDVGDSMLSSIGGEHAPWWRVNQERTAFEATDAVDVFFGDVEAGLAQRAVSQLWRYQSYVAATQALTEAAWKVIPSTYLICEADNALPLSVQEPWATRAEKVLRIGTSHSPFLSRPAELARLIEDEVACAR